MAADGEGGRLQAGDGLLGAVVLLAAGVGLDGDLLGGAAGRHRQRALGGGDVVVAGLGALVQGVGEGVLGAAHDGLGARHVVGRALALGEAVAGDLHLVVGQGRAVVGLGVGGGGQGHLALADGQLAADELDFGSLAVAEHFTFGIVDDNMVASLGRKSVLSRVLYLAVLCALIGNDRRITGDVEGFVADLNLDALLSVPVRDLFNALKSSGTVVIPIISEAVRLSDNGEGVLNGLPLCDIGRISGHGLGNLGVPTLEGVAPSDGILDSGGIVSVEKIAVGRLLRRILQRSVVKLVLDGVLDRRPLGRQSNVGLGHGEDASRLNGGVVGRFLPAGKLVASLLRLLGGDGYHIAGCVECLGVRAPGAAVQVVGHDVVGYVLRVEVHVLGDSIGELDVGSGQVAVGAPCDQAVRAAVDGLRVGQAAHAAGDAHRLALAHRFAALVLVGCRTGVPQIEPGRSEPLGLDHDLAVHVIAISIG